MSGLTELYKAGREVEFKIYVGDMPVDIEDDTIPSLIRTTFQNSPFSIGEKGLKNRIQYLGLELKETIQSYEEGVPDDIQSILDSSDPLSFNKQELLQRYIRARDKVITAQSLSEAFGCPLKFPQKFSDVLHSESVIDCASKFDAWFDANKNKGRFDNIEVLTFAGKQLSKLDYKIGELPLQYLGLGENRLIDLPPEIGNLENLESLDLSLNQFEDIPQAIVGLSKLTTLDLRGNPIQNVKEKVTQFFS